MTKEDIEFLKELQHELLSQDSDGQAAPRYWGIMQRKDIAVPDGCGEAYIYMGSDSPSTATEFVEYIEDNYLDGMTGEELTEWNKLNKTDIYELVDYANNVLKWGDIRIVYMEQRDVFTTDSNVFLTKRAAKKHIELYGYNYSKPRTYAMTASRNPEFERVVKILETTDWDKIGKSL